MIIFSNWSLNKATRTISIGLFIISLTQKCYCTTRGCGDSIAVLISGSIGFFLCYANLTWLANPLLLISWIQINRNCKLSWIMSLLATIISLSFLLFTRIMDNEGGFYSEIISYKIGYWLWLASSLTMLIGNTITYFLKPAQLSVSLGRDKDKLIRKTKPDGIKTS